MDTKIIVAVVAAITSLIVAVIAWLTARHTAKAQVEYQKAQAEYQRKLEALRLAESEVAPAQAAANVLWKELQVLKQALDILLVDGHPESEDAVEAADAAATALSIDYADQGHLLPQHIRGLWHGIKNEGHEVNQIVREYKDRCRYDRTIPV